MREKNRRTGTLWMMAAALFVLTTTGAFAEAGWHATLDDAKTAARRSGKDIMVYFYTTKAERCVEIRQELLTSTFLRELAGKFELFQVDVLESSKTVQEIAPDIVKVPVFAVLFPTGETKEMLKGSWTVNEWRRRLRQLMDTARVSGVTTSGGASAGGPSMSFDQLVEQGKQAIRAKDLSKAENAYKRALALRPGDSTALNNLGFIEAQRGDFAKAANYFRLCLVDNPNDSTARQNLALAEQQLKSKGRASAPSGRSQVDQKLQQAKQALNSGQLGRAKSLYEEVERIDRGNLDAINNLGVIEAQQGNLREAIVYWERVLEQRPNDADAKSNIDLARKMLKR